MLNFNSPLLSAARRNVRSIWQLSLFAAFVLLMTSLPFAQTTISTGSIVGTVTDPTGAVVSGAKVEITNKGTGQTQSFTTSSAGAYASGALTPGDYMVRIEANGF